MAYGDLDSQDIWIMSVCLFVAVCSTLMQLYYLNQAIARYQQIEVSAIYQVTIMIFTVVCALVIMDEASAYNVGGLLSIFGGTALCMIGI